MCTAVSVHEQRPEMSVFHVRLCYSRAMNPENADDDPIFAKRS